MKICHVNLVFIIDDLIDWFYSLDDKLEKF